MHTSRLLKGPSLGKIQLFSSNFNSKLNIGLRIEQWLIPKQHRSINGPAL